MEFSIQKANGWKRLSAFIFDAVIFMIAAAGIGALLSLVLGYGAGNRRMQELITSYEQTYDIRLDITEAEYESYPPEIKAKYDAAYAAFAADQEVIVQYRKVINLMLLMVTFSLLAAFLLLEFLVPCLLGYGRTAGKKIFGLAVINTEGVKMRKTALFARTVLGKYAIETMIPAYVLTMIFFNQVGLLGSALMMGLLAVQAVMYFTTPTHSLIHDKLANTVVVDYASQHIFETVEDMIEAKKKAAAEKAVHREW